MSEYVGTASTVEELIAILSRYPAEFPVRLQSLSHEWPVDVRKHKLCLTLEF